MKECPRCGFEDHGEGSECPQCGIIYEKYYKLMAKKEAGEEPAHEEEEKEEEQRQIEVPLGELPIEEEQYVEQKTPYEYLDDFVRKNYVFIIAGVFLLFVVSCIIFCVKSRTVGKTGIVSWYNILGEKAETDLLFDTIDLLKRPIYIDEEESTTSQDDEIICVMSSGTRVKVLKEAEEYYKIKVLEGICEGEIGFIIQDHFEKL